uniref:protein-tyrosine-phosphatase n=1 Tax=Panagrellus redivivus TaxID=6233 RepID=A0A7E4ZSS1_PANRE
MFNLVNRCSSFVASVASNVIPATVDDESSRDSGVSDLGVASGSTASITTGTSTNTTTTVVATSFEATFSTQTSTESQQSVIFQDFEKEFVRPSRWTTSSESSEDYQDRMSLIGDEQQLTQQQLPQATPTATPPRSRDASSGSLSATVDEATTSLSSSANALNRKRSAPALMSEFSPLHKTVKSDSSHQSDQASLSVLRESNALITTPETRAADEATTPTIRRHTIRKYESLRTNMLKQRSECMKSPELLKAKDKSDENFDLGDDDVFFAENEDDFVLQDAEIKENEPLRSMSVEISPIHPVDRFNEDNASFAARRRSLLEGTTPTRRYNSAFEPSDSSTPAGSRFRRMPVKLDSSGDEGDGNDVGAPTVFSPLPKSTSMNDLSVIEKSQVNHYHLPVTSDDKATVERCPISAKTLRDTLASLSDEEFKKKYILIDARYPYEYRGGHVRHAINCHRPENIADVFFNPETFDEIKTKIPIFYCEFSQARGPNMVQALRRFDRHRNLKDYPKLDYPELYLLYGGYRTFYNTYKKQGFCVPDHYTKMMSKNHTAELKMYDSHKTTHEKGKSKMKKAQWHAKQKELRQACIFSSSDEKPSSSKKTAPKLTGNGLVDAEFNREIAKSEFLSTSSSQRYHAFDSSPDNSELSSFSHSPSRTATAPIPIPSSDSSDSSQRHGPSDDSDHGGPIQLSFSSCL